MMDRYVGMARSIFIAVCDHMFDNYKMKNYRIYVVGQPYRYGVHSI